MKLLLLFLFGILQLTKQFFLIIDGNNSKCISKFLSANEQFSGSYLISGENEESAKIYISNEQGIILWEVFGQKNGSFNMSIKQDGTYLLCVSNEHSKQIAFSFDFIDAAADDKILSIDNISNLNSYVHSIRKKMDIIGSNMKNANVRRQSHFEIIQRINSSINFYTFIKILFILLFSGFQIYMITSAFSNIKVTDRVYVGNVGDRSNASDNAIL